MTEEAFKRKLSGSCQVVSISFPKGYRIFNTEIFLPKLGIGKVVISLAVYCILLKKGKYSM